MLHIKAERLLRHRSIGHFVIKMNKFCRHRKIGRHKVNSRPMDFLSKYFWIYQIYGRQSTLPLNLQWPVTNLSLECATEACNGCSQMHFKNKCYSNHLRRSLENFFDNFFFCCSSSFPSPLLVMPKMRWIPIEKHHNFHVRSHSRTHRNGTV